MIVANGTPSVVTPAWKVVNGYVRRHRFYHSVTDPSASGFTTSERRAFERDVYDYARALGLTRLESKERVAKARELCADEVDDGESSFENEVDDSQAILRTLRAKDSSVPQSSNSKKGRTASTSNTIVAGRKPSTPHSSGFFGQTSPHNDVESSPSKRKSIDGPDMSTKAQGQKKKRKLEGKVHKLPTQLKGEHAVKIEGPEKDDSKGRGNGSIALKDKQRIDQQAHKIPEQEKPSKEAKKLHTATKEASKEASDTSVVDNSTIVTEEEAKTTTKATPIVDGKKRGTGKGAGDVRSQGPDSAYKEKQDPIVGNSKDVIAVGSQSEGRNAEDTLEDTKIPAEASNNTEEIIDADLTTKKKKTAQKSQDQEKRRKFFDDLLQDRRDGHDLGALELSRAHVEEKPAESTSVSGNAPADVLQLQQEMTEANQLAKPRKKRKKKSESSGAKEPLAALEKEHKKKSKKRKSKDVLDGTDELSKIASPKKAKKHRESAVEEPKPDHEGLKAIPSTEVKDGPAKASKNVKDSISKAKKSDLPTHQNPSQDAGF